jgi:p-hydroxybenzoate 3-monooxygenase
MLVSGTHPGTHPQRSGVVIVGAGPAGLLLGNLLRADGIDCVVLERQSQSHVEQRARAGFLAANTVRILTEHGMSSGLEKHGRRHDTCAFRSDLSQFVVNYGQLARGEVHTVYPQQDLVRDLIAEYLDRGGVLRFGMTAEAIDDIDTDHPSVLCRDEDGRPHRWTGQFIAGCDGQHGVSRFAVPVGAAHRYQRDHGVSWLAVLAEAPQSMSTVTYAIHDQGFAGHMARGATVTRYYLQCAADDTPAHWPQERIWNELHVRFRASEYGNLVTGPIFERRVINMASNVMDPIQYRRLFLAGDAANLISPCGAKGANLAIMEAEALALALTACLRQDDQKPLARYSADCLLRVWRAQEFSHWMLNLLHGPTKDTADADFLRALQRARLERLRTSEADQESFAENYIGI